MVFPPGGTPRLYGRRDARRHGATRPCWAQAFLDVVGEAKQDTFCGWQNRTPITEFLNEYSHFLHSGP
jgi:hypothetical protein